MILKGLKISNYRTVILKGLAGVQLAGWVVHVAELHHLVVVLMRMMMISVMFMMVLMMMINGDQVQE